jgi:hypothetical protein
VAKAVNRPYVVSVSLTQEEMRWLRELAQLQGGTEERVLRQELRRLRTRELKRQAIRKEVYCARVEVAG